MARLMLSDERWSKLQEIMLQHGIYDKPNLRMMVEAILYRMRQLSPERKIPKLEMLILIGVYTNIAIWLKTCSHDLSIFEPSPPDTIS